MSVDISQLADHSQLTEPELLFHPERSQETEVHPLRGLLRFGPYSRALLQAVIDPIRVAIVAPFGGSDAVRQVLGELSRRHFPKERKAYLQEFPGFTRIFRVNVVAAPDQAVYEFPQAFDEQLAQSSAPYVQLAEALSRALSALSAHRSEFDVIAIYLPDRWSAGFYGPEDSDFDLHDYLKAVMAGRGIPTQIIRENSAVSYPCRCSVMWRLGIALYTKAGGIPWKIAHAEPETAFIGLSYAIREDQLTGPQFVTCCSQVFDSHGAGLEFVAYETDDVRIEHDNPFLSRAEMRRVMARSLILYQRQHGGKTPQRVVVHKSTPFKDDEVEGCFDALRACPNIDLIQVQQDVAWRGILIEPPVAGLKKGQPGNYPAHRGTSVQLDGRSVLLWTQGNAPTAVGGKDFYKEGKGIPSPLLLRRYAGHGRWDAASTAVMALTKMNWNNDALYDRLPVTMAYAHVLARVVKRMPTLLPQPYQFRFFM
jgi:hypothetical protein